MAVFLPVLLFLSNLLNYLDRQLFTALFPVLAPAYHLSDTKMGLLGSSFTLSYLVAAPVVGVLLDRFSPRFLLSTGVLVFSLGMAIASTASGTIGLFSGRILTGVGEASLIVVGPRILGGRKGGGRRLGLFFLALPIGVATGFLLASRALSDFHRILFLPVLPGILLGMMFLLPFVKGRQDSDTLEDCTAFSLPVISRFSLLFLDARLRILVFLQSVTFFVMGGMSVWLSVYLTRVRHLSIRETGQMSAVVLVIGGIVGILLSGVFCDKIQEEDHAGMFFLLSWTQFLALAGICLVLVSERRPLLWLGMLLSSGALFGLNVSLVVAFMRASSPAFWGCVLGGGLFLAHLAGDLPAGTLIGMVSTHMGLRAGVEILLPGPLLAGLLVVVWRGMRERRQSESSRPPFFSG
ncbi:MAG: MFS transporter [Leptospirillia bacterium]